MAYIHKFLKMQQSFITRFAPPRPENIFTDVILVLLDPYQQGHMGQEL